MDLGLKGKAAIVCGASRGMGRATAEMLAAEGVALTLLARNPERLEAAAADIRARFGVTVTAVAGDVTRAEDRDRLVAACPAPDILVTNADGMPPGDFRAWSRDDWIAALDAMMLGPIEMIRRTVDGMMKGRFGRIVNISSTSGVVGNAGQANYAAAKAGLMGLTKTIARELGSKGITANVIAPGFIQTDMTNDLPQQVKDAVLGMTATKRFGTPEDIAACVQYVTSDAAGFLTGQTICVDGGMTMC